MHVLNCYAGVYQVGQGHSFWVAAVSESWFWI